MIRHILLAIAVTVAGVANAEIAYNQPHDSSGTLRQSSWWQPDDSDWDVWVWDNFTLNASQAITEIAWRGGYIYGGMYSGSVVDFTVSIYPSIAANSEPDVVGGPLVTYETGGNAGQTLAGVFGGKTMYDYHFLLPAPFQAAAGTRYWVQIEAWQSYIPEWGLAAGTGGNGAHFRWMRGAHQYQHAPGDVAFALMTTGGLTYSITASADPANGGTIQGAGDYPAGSMASLVAIPNTGFGFVSWTENGATVSTSTTYTFPVTADRALVAHFTPAYTITTSASPAFAGTTSGGGTFNSGQSVTVVATANAAFSFVNWTEFGAPVSTTPSYTFTATANRNLVANFGLDPLSVLFDFDNAPIHTSLPIDVSAGGITAHLSATGGGFSIQRADTMGFTPAGFSGLCIYPNSVFPADLLFDYSATLTDFSILFSPQELGCDDSATMRVTVYMDNTLIGTATTTAPQPGTWPTGTLRIVAPSGFNRAVVHYDARPPTCQDWGPIFLADNMVVKLAPPPCPGDLNGNGAVDLSDLAQLLAHFGTPGGATPANGDLDSDGDVDLNDLTVLLSHFGTVCS